MIIGQACIRLPRRLDEFLTKEDERSIQLFGFGGRVQADDMISSVVAAPSIAFPAVLLSCPCHFCRPILLCLQRGMQRHSSGQDYVLSNCSLLRRVYRS
jgi:hypothetical protein